MAEPTGLIAKSGIELLTFGTPNGVKISILLEELKEAYGKDYTFQSINIMKNTQKQPWFTAVNPNGRIPAIVDHDRNGFAVFEGMAILGYLTRHYDPELKFSFPIDSDYYSEAEQWMAWFHGGAAPIAQLSLPRSASQGQANHFAVFSKEKIPYPVQRFIGETERVYGVLDTRLKDRDWVVGPGRGKYSIVDMSMAGWVNGASYLGLDLNQFPNVKAWFERLSARPATVRGLNIPTTSPFGNAAYAKRLAEEPEFREKAAEAKKFVDEAKSQYGYKYSSP